MDRRTFVFAGFAAAMDAAVGNPLETPRLETLTQWLNASRKTRRAALQSCLDRIRAMDPSIHAWVQVLPQRPTGNGALADIPFGAKDIFETQGLVTEYGSPIYKGRIGTADAAIVQDLRRRGRSYLARPKPRRSRFATPPPLTIRVTYPTRQGEVPVDRQL